MSLVVAQWFALCVMCAIVVFKLNQDELTQLDKKPFIVLSGIVGMFLATCVMGLMGLVEHVHRWMGGAP